MGQILQTLLSWFQQKKLDAVVIGIQGSGKSTLTSRLSMEKLVNKGPTIGLDYKSFQKGKVKMNVWDLGGHQLYRAEWPTYVTGSDVIIFVLDAADKETVGQAKLELNQLLQNKSCQNIPLLIIGNKIDLQGHMIQQEIIEGLSLDYLRTNHWVVIMASMLKGNNIEEIVQWLIEKSKSA